jgi:hypothetical protein
MKREDTNAGMGTRNDDGTAAVSDFVQVEITKFAAIIKQEGLQMDVRRGPAVLARGARDEAIQLSL